MVTKSCPKIIKYTIITVLFTLCGISLLFASDPPAVVDNKGYVLSNPKEETKKDTALIKEKAPVSGLVDISQKHKDMSGLQIEARTYRNHGLELQKLGQLDEALAFYQKAAELDSSYAVVFNDLGVIYEAMGDIERAETSYSHAIRIDPAYLSPYTNLALLYEEKRDMDKAAIYWKKRADFGSLDDPLTIKANKRFKDIMAVQELSAVLPERSREQEIIDLAHDVANQKALQRRDDGTLAEANFRKAKLSYNKHEEANALKEAMDAQQLDPNNKEIGAFIEKVQHRLLSR